MSLYSSGQTLHAADLQAGLVASWKLTPSLTGITAETDVINVSWTPPAVGCYRFRAKIPNDVSATPTDVKVRLLVNGTEITFQVPPGAGGAFVTNAFLDETMDITSTSAITLRATINRVTSTNTLNSRLTEARLEVYTAGATGIRA